MKGHGYICVKDPNSNSKVVHRPKIIIAFNINDKSLAEKLYAEFKVGKVVSLEKAVIVLLQVVFVPVFYKYFIFNFFFIYLILYE